MDYETTVLLTLVKDTVSGCKLSMGAIVLQKTASLDECIKLYTEHELFFAIDYSDVSNVVTLWNSHKKMKGSFHTTDIRSKTNKINGCVALQKAKIRRVGRSLNIFFIYCIFHTLFLLFKKSTMNGQQ